jgi:acetolactate decarboxylase
MTRVSFSRLAAVTLTSAIFLSAIPVQATNEPPSTLIQVGTYDYLTQPDFTGLTSVGRIAQGHTLGLGTFANLDGELVMLGGAVYQVRPDGTPRVADPAARTPFMQAIRFRPQVDAPVPPGTTCAQLPALITELAKQGDGIIAVRIRGTFSDLMTRSVTADPPPFQPLSQTIAEQTVFDLGERRAALVGFWQGRDALGIGQDGLHLHGLTADRTAGGHVLSCVIGDDVQLSIQRVASVDIRTPQ